MIYKYLQNEALEPSIESRLPRVYVEPLEKDSEEVQQTERVRTPCSLAEWRKRNFSEVEASLSSDEAVMEAHRCLRCDLEFTQPKEKEEELMVTEAGGS